MGYTTLWGTTGGWHPTKNKRLNPDWVLATSQDVAWWICDLGHDFPQAIKTRVAGGRCRVCAHLKAHPSTCLSATHKKLSREWHRSKNGRLRPRDVTSGMVTVVWWQCPKSPLHVYDQKVNVRVLGSGCPYCANRKVCADNCMRATRPDLVPEFMGEENYPFTVDNIVAGTRETLMWRCALGHEWPASGWMRQRGYGCPTCSNHKVLIGFNDMATTAPWMVDDWDFEANGDLQPTDVVAKTSTQIHWKCAAEGHSWSERGYMRFKRVNGCVECWKKRRSTQAALSAKRRHRASA